MPSSDSRSPLAATKRVFTRPANLHLAWSASKGIASPVVPSTLSTSTTNTSASGDSSRLPYTISTTKSDVPQLSSHPYSSFSFRTRDDRSAELFSRFSTSSPLERSASCSSPPSWTSPMPELSKSVLQCGRLTWCISGKQSNRVGLSNGFEKALRRRQANKKFNSKKDQAVFAALEQVEVAGDVSRFPSPTGAGFEDRRFSDTVYLASPGVCDPSAFDNDGLVSLVPPPVPLRLIDHSRWVPPPSWDILDPSSGGRDSRSRSSGSSSSELLRTPGSSQLGSPRERHTYLCIYPLSATAGPTPSASHVKPLMKLRIDSDSTVEIQHSTSEIGPQDPLPNLAESRLIVTGELVPDSRKATCVLSPLNVAELNEWLYAIEDVIKHSQCGKSLVSASRRRSSASMLDTIRLLEQLQVGRNSLPQLEMDAWRREKDHEATPQATPAVSALSFPPFELHPGTANSVASIFSPSSFIDYYATTTNPDSATSHTTGDDAAHFDFEEAYSSIMSRFDDEYLFSPIGHLENLPSAALEDRLQCVGRDECLDVPVSPCSYEFSPGNRWNEDVGEAPSSPLDPWISCRTRSSIPTGSLSDGEETFGNEEVMQIFAEGFRVGSPSK